MAITITVEDGSIVTDANSYVSIDDAVAYAAQRGVIIPATSPTERDAVAAKLIKAADYLASFEDQYKGRRVNPFVQDMSWPRKCVVMFGEDWDYTKIPPQLEAAQEQLVLEQVNGVDLSPTVTGYAVKREKVGPLETEYDTARGPGSSGPNMPIVDALLAPLLNGGHFRLTSDRA